ncbi:hypothetical protein K458DRAFT_296696 [Lentithecium fluviatile CBS 122367]|uniref:Uncharacterized protein n=1 Tax=Lentithecium fluviatile CBS 122367 TaxID=1168545 RepID=A0A6G1JA98_9PLEO|nr:hypothetical protein K458DRAFT_296696 [Lentithecium fluviatile CBS 122367]
MSKRNSDGDVLFNRLAVGVAQEQSLLASLMGSELDAEPQNETSETATEDKDAMSAGDDEQFGVGAKIPKEIGNGTFTRRVPTSDDKLLQQLIGKKAAKAHLEAKQASKHSAKQPGQKHSKPHAAPKKEESEDEEEGRASAFKSKKRKTTKAQPAELKIKELGIDDNLTDESPSAQDHRASESASKENHIEKSDVSDAEESKKIAPKSRHRQSKPASYLDQLLAERSKKKKKSKSQVDT